MHRSYDMRVCAVNYEILQNYPSLDMIFMRFSQFDLLWPQVTFAPPPKINDDHGQTTHYEVIEGYPTW